MTDNQLELRLRDWYRAEIPADETAPAALRARLTTIPRASSVSSRRFASRRGITLLAAAALVGLLAGAAAVGSLLRPPAPPIPPAVWTATGEMINDHAAHTATLLPDGTVLAAGGGVDPQTDFAELYDPSTGLWTATGDMTRGRVDHTATLLDDGTVLVAGGGGGGAERTASAELYDPSTASWTATGNMIRARSAHTATLLPDGRVLVAGGATDPDLATAELYDPRTGTWTATGNLVEGRSTHTATLLPDGTVLLAGGAASSELYDPRTGTWTATGAMVHARWDATATLLPDGTVLVAGDGEGATSAELYDPRSGTWTATGPMTQGRHSHLTATLLPDGTVLVAGGHSGLVDLTDQELASAELYEPLSRTWTATASMATARRYHTAILLRDGTVLVAGGVGDDDAAGSAELYHLGSMPAVVPPTAPASANPSAELPSATPTALPASAGLIAYAQFGPLRAHTRECPTGARRLYQPSNGSGPGCSRIWVSNTDGTGAHELVPDHLGNQTPLEWSPDGTLLLFEDAAGIWLIDASGTIVKSFPFEDLCRIECGDIGGYAFSPDGATIAFARPPITTSGESVIALLELATGHVTELASTAPEGNDAPHWSPDGTRLTFARQPGGPAGATLYMVNADGSNLHKYVPLDLYAIEPRWSPDDSLIAFVSVDTPDLEANDIYVVRPDGTGLLRLTTGGVSARPEWTADGRIVYARAAGVAGVNTIYELWIMDADGANQAKLPVEDAVQLTAAHCVACAWVRDPDSETWPTEFMTNSLWQPQP